MNRTASVRYRAFLKGKERWSATQYDDNGHPAIGWGHDIRPGETFVEPISLETGDEVLVNDLRVAESAVNSLVVVQITQGQFDALVDVVYNAGPGALAKSKCLRDLNAGDFAGARAEYLGFCHDIDPHTGQKVVNADLVERRKEGAEQFWDAPDSPLDVA